MYRFPLKSINHSNLTVAFTSADHIPTLLKLVPGTPSLKLIVSFDELPEEARSVLKSWAETLNVQVQTLRECRWQLNDSLEQILISM